MYHCRKIPNKSRESTDGSSLKDEVKTEGVISIPTNNSIFSIPEGSSQLYGQVKIPFLWVLTQCKFFTYSSYSTTYGLNNQMTAHTSPSACMIPTLKIWGANNKDPIERFQGSHLWVSDKTMTTLTYNQWPLDISVDSQE